MKYCLLFISFISFTSFSQNWSLQQCIDSGVVNNYTIASSQITSSILKEGIVESKSSYIPSLNSGMTHGYNWGQILDPFTNEFAKKQVQYNNFYLRSSVSLFSGMSTRHNIHLQRIDLEQEEYNRILAERDLKINISIAYLQEGMKVYQRDPSLSSNSEYLFMVATSASAALSTFIRPERHALLDIGGEILPEPNPFDPAEQVIPIFNYTNLVAPDKPMTIKISRVDRTGNNPRLRAVATIKGKMQDWPLNASFGKAFPTVFHNTVTVFNNNKGRLKFDALRNAIAQFGQPMQINGLSWNRVLEIEIKITGQDTQNGFQATAKKSVKQRYYVINSDNETPTQIN